MRTRREFLQQLPGAAAGLCVLGALPALAAGCVSVPYVRAEQVDGLLRVPFTSLDADGRALVESAGLELPLFVRRVAGASPVVLSTRCTHRGCEVEPGADRLICPCHGSEYDLHGAVLEGPAELPLRRHSARESEDAILIAVAPMERA